MRHLVLLATAVAACTATCYIDTVAKRQMRYCPTAQSPSSCAGQGIVPFVSRGWCQDKCGRMGKKLAGLEAGHACFCDDTLATPSATVAEAQCNTTCIADVMETCGGIYRLEVLPASKGPFPPPPPPPSLPTKDPRWIPGGRVIHTGGYCCQPYCSVLLDAEKTWSCVMTFNPHSWIEGQPGEHMVAMQSTDQGMSWSKFVPIEPYSNSTTNQVSAYGSVTARADGSRIFALWIQNTANISHLPGQAPSDSFRADMLGQFIWRYSDDKGASWSKGHYVIPTPMRFIDRHNTWNGSVQIMWEVDHIKHTKDGGVVFAFTKIGTYAVAPPEEIYFLKSPNLLTEADPTKVVWSMYPTSDHGVEAVSGTSAGPLGISEEPHVIPLTEVDADHVVFRTSQGYLGSSQSQTGDREAPWQPSGYAQYLPLDGGDGWLKRLHPNASAVKNCRGPISPKRQPNGQILMTYYNNNAFGRAFSHMPLNDRNNMFLTAGYELGGTLQWSQPELALYDHRRDHGHGYPDIITDHNGTFITETYKSTPQAEAKTHLLPQEMLDLLFQQRTISTVATASLAASFTGGAASIAIPAGTFPNFAGVYLHARYGFTLDFWLRGSGVDAGNADNLDVAGSDAVVLFSSKAAGKSRAGTAAGGVADAATEEAGAAPGGAEVTVSMASNGTVSIVLKDGEDDGADDATWWTDPTCSARLRGASGTSGGARHLGIVVDAGPKMIMFTVDGHLCDGGAHVSGYTPAAAASSALPDGLAAGWHLFSPELGAVGGATASVGSTVIKGRIYSRALYTTELVGNWRAGPGRAVVP